MSGWCQDANCDRRALEGSDRCYRHGGQTKIPVAKGVMSKSLSIVTENKSEPQEVNQEICCGTSIAANPEGADSVRFDLPPLTPVKVPVFSAVPKATGQLSLWHTPSREELEAARKDGCACVLSLQVLMSTPPIRPIQLRACRRRVHARCKRTAFPLGCRGNALRSGRSIRGMGGVHRYCEAQ